MNNYRTPLVYLLGIVIASLCPRAECAPSFNVCDYGAMGDGSTLDTAPLNKAIEACAAVGGGRVLISPDKYLTGTVHLKSNVMILLDAGAELIGTPDLDQYQNFTPPKEGQMAITEARLVARNHRTGVLGRHAHSNHQAQRF